MARSTYIYLIREPEDNLIIAAFTVKREAHEWMRRSGFNFLDYNLFRMRDGLCGYSFGIKIEVKVDWDE